MCEAAELLWPGSAGVKHWAGFTEKVRAGRVSTAYGGQQPRDAVRHARPDAAVKRGVRKIGQSYAAVTGTPTRSAGAQQ
jgi:hypothetical protein